MSVSLRQAIPRLWSTDAGFLTATLAVAALVGPLAAAAGLPGLIVMAALTVIVVIAMRPAFGAYLYLFATPLIVGIARGDALSVLRPNEGLLGLIVLALVGRVLFLALRGRPYRPSFTRIDLALVLMAFCASVVPLTLRYGRGQPITNDDMLYAAVLWKYFIVYRIFREAVSSPSQVVVCLWVSLASAAIVALVAILQVMNLFGVPEFLLAYYDDPFSSADAVTDRGTSTIASSFGVANVMAMNLAIVLAMLAGTYRRRHLLLAAGAVFVLGCVASGQFSGFIGLAIVTGSVVLIAAQARMLLTIIFPAGAVSGLVLWPVIAERLSGFDNLAGLPPSWVGRLNNLQQYIWPELFSGWNWLLGVRPAARVPAPEPWRDWVFIESGYTWLLWTGGLPMLLAFGFFVRCSLQDLWTVGRGRADPVGVAAAASFSWLIAMAVLMLFDPHLTMRGSADLFFPLLALAFVGASRPADAGMRPNARHAQANGNETRGLVP